MNSLRNKVTLIGNLGEDPTLIEHEDGTKETNMMLATQSKFKKGREVHMETQWHKLKAFGKVAEILDKYTAKGSEIAVEGELISRMHNGEQQIYIQVNDFLIIGGKSR